MGAPRGDYTPFGLVANPWAEAHSWSQQDGTGGILRTTEQAPGLCWLEPWGLRPSHGLGLEIGFGPASSELRFPATRAELARFRLRSSYHSANALCYEWTDGDLQFEARFFSPSANAISCYWHLRNTGSVNRQARLRLGVWVWRRATTPSSEMVQADRDLVEDRAARATLTWEPGASLIGQSQAHAAPESVAGRNGLATRRVQEVELQVPAGAAVSWSVALGRGVVAHQEARQAVERCSESWSALLARDGEFWSTCPRLTGAWPTEFKNGFVYDFETTRMCLQTAGGIFTDIWPAWMVNWPRVVLAEGSLDMLRLSFAQPELAQRAVLGMFRDAPAANVPCVFKHGEPNMVAADGEVCGTSPAWCVPFHNLKRLYLRTLDRAWLSELYPHLAAYVRWWVANRSDADGWTVYRCTWEAGEDNSTRLDPDGEGDHVISQYARPIELQAAMADAAATLAFFAAELSLPGEEWGPLEQAARARVQQLWDPAEGRFRDVDTRRGAFIEPSGRNDYWGTDPRRFSALSLTPLLFGQTTPDQTHALRQEIEHYTRPPWCDWPSWSYVVLEAASRAGWYDFAGRLAHDICRRVYAETDAREIGAPDRPMPGVAREYWPSDLSTWNASEGYGWGASTASFLLRQLCGFYEAEDTTDCTFRLAPGLPPSLLAGELGVGPLPYRGALFQLSYRPTDGDALDVRVSAEQRGVLRVTDEGTGRLVLETPAQQASWLRLSKGQVIRVQLGQVR